MHASLGAVTIRCRSPAPFGPSQSWGNKALLGKRARKHPAAGAAGVRAAAQAAERQKHTEFLAVSKRIIVPRAPPHPTYHHRTPLYDSTRPPKVIMSLDCPKSVSSTRYLAALKWWLEPASPPATPLMYASWCCGDPPPRPRTSNRHTT